jgi:formylglycine-generating enzyme required for sulfatase activity
MVGNVWEWVASEYRKYPFDVNNDVNNVQNVNDTRLRGASYIYDSPQQIARTAFRSLNYGNPRLRDDPCGVRLARGL